MHRSKIRTKLKEELQEQCGIDRKMGKQMLKTNSYTKQVKKKSSPHGDYPKIRTHYQQTGN